MSSSAYFYAMMAGLHLGCGAWYVCYKLGWAETPSQIVGGFIGLGVFFALLSVAASRRSN